MGKFCMIPVAVEDSRRDQNTLNLTAFQDNCALCLFVSLWFFCMLLQFVPDIWVTTL